MRTPQHGAIVRRLFEVADLCSDAIVRRADRGIEIDGTPTETALIEGGARAGVDVGRLRLSARVLASGARGDGRKRMSTLHETGDGAQLLCVKGDPVEVLARCSDAPHGRWRRAARRATHAPHPQGQ